MPASWHQEWIQIWRGCSHICLQVGCIFPAASEGRKKRNSAYGMFTCCNNNAFSACYRVRPYSMTALQWMLAPFRICLPILLCGVAFFSSFPEACSSGMLQNTLKGAHCVDTSLFRKIEATAISRHLVLNMRVAFFSSLAGSRENTSDL